MDACTTHTFTVYIAYCVRRYARAINGTQYSSMSNWRKFVFLLIKDTKNSNQNSLPPISLDVHIFDVKRRKRCEIFSSVTVPDLWKRTNNQINHKVNISCTRKKYMINGMLRTQIFLLTKIGYKRFDMRIQYAHVFHFPLPKSEVRNELWCTTFGFQ